MNPFDGYRITSPYGPRIHPVTHQPHFHTGIDLVKYHRAPIYAFAGGQVVYAGEGKSGTGFGGFGIVVAIKDRNSCLQCYIHLDSVSVAVGDTVERGQEIGKQGNTGKYSTGSHLHFEVRKKSAPSFGWTEAEEPRCYEPTQYLIDYYAKEDDEMTALEEVRKIQKIVEEQATRIEQLEKHSENQAEKIGAPDWFRKEFPGVAEKVHEPMEYLGWRAVAVALRALK